METVIYKLFGFIPVVIVKRKIDIDDEIVKKISEDVKSSLTKDINDAISRMRR